METAGKCGISTVLRFTEEYNSFWPPKCGGDSKSHN
jgi:hypothetical protein